MQHAASSLPDRPALTSASRPLILLSRRRRLPLWCNPISSLRALALVLLVELYCAFPSLDIARTSIHQVPSPLPVPWAVSGNRPARSLAQPAQAGCKVPASPFAQFPRPRRIRLRRPKSRPLVTCSLPPSLSSLFLPLSPRYWLKKVQSAGDGKTLTRTAEKRQVARAGGYYYLTLPLAVPYLPTYLTYTTCPAPVPPTGWLALSPPHPAQRQATPRVWPCLPFPVLLLPS